MLKCGFQVKANVSGVCFAVSLEYNRWGEQTRHAELYDLVGAEHAGPDRRAAQRGLADPEAELDADLDGETRVEQLVAGVHPRHLQQRQRVSQQV